MYKHGRYNRTLRNLKLSRIKKLTYNDVDEMSVDLQTIGSQLSKSIGEWIAKYDWHNNKKEMPNSSSLIKQWANLIEAHDAFKREMSFMLSDISNSQDLLE